MNDFIALAESFLFIFAFIGLATLLLRKQLLGPAATRKVVHIGVSHWWLLYLGFIVSPWVGLVGALTFVGINSISYRYRLFKAMEDPEPGKNLGTIWFPLSLALLIGLEIAGFLTRWEAGVGVLIMGWGDGMAAVFGQRLSTRTFLVFGNKKSFAGTLAMAGFSFVITMLFCLWFAPGLPLGTLILRAGATALFATLIELATPLGLDNLTVPVFSALFFTFLAQGPLAGPIVGALALNAFVGWGAYKKKAVDGSGAVIGTAVGTLILCSGGFAAYALLGGFFLSSTLIGRAVESRKGPSQVEAKGSRRDALQVLANAGTAGIAALLFGLTHETLWLAAFATSFASANADTWASEIGVLYRRLPKSILTGKEVPAGASGGVTPLGFLASALGAAFIGVLFAASYASLSPLRIEWGLIAVLASLGGFAGSVVDSLLGASVQAKYSCPTTGRYTERPRSKEGVPNVLIHGHRWFTNDMVNFTSTLAVAAAAAGVYVLLS